MSNAPPNGDLKELTSAISQLASRFSSPPPPRQERRPHPYAMAVAILALLVSGSSAWYSRQSASVSERNLEWLHETRQRDEKLRTLEIADHFIDRFYRLEKEKDEKDPKQVNVYYDSLYGLHSEEFMYYRKGLLDRDIYLSWLRFRYRHFSKDQQKEQQQFDRVRQIHIVDKDFNQFMDGVLHVRGEDEIAPLLDRVVKPVTQ
jgi:hypothetical protein